MRFTEKKSMETPYIVSCNLHMLIAPSKDGCVFFKCDHDEVPAFQIPFQVLETSLIFIIAIFLLYW